MSNTRAAWFFVITLTVIRLAMIGTRDLEFDEAHYWLWSDRLARLTLPRGRVWRWRFAPGQPCLALTSSESAV